MSIELIEPYDKSDMSNAVARRLAQSGEGFYHLAAEVADVAATSSELKQNQVRVIDRPAIEPEDSARWLVHPKDANGVMGEGLETGWRD